MRSTSSKLHVICVCCGTGFPNGLAQASRMRMVGQVLLKADVRFTVYHIGGSDFENSEPEGCAEGVAYKYFPGLTRRPAQALMRQVIYLYGAFKMLAEFRRRKRRGEPLIVYLWVKRGFLGRLLLNGFRWLNIPVVLEFNEWWPGDKADAERRFAHSMSAGSLPISFEIKKRLSEGDGYKEVSRKMFRLPILIDAKAWAPDGTKYSTAKGSYYLWCGNVASSERDIQFMIESFGKVLEEHPDVKLVLAGRASAEIIQWIQATMRTLGIPDESVQLPGYVALRDLKTLMWNAVGLLLPLWDEERSICRFPTKLGEYLASGTPVITSKTGDVGRFLEDRISALIGEAGSVQDFADGMNLAVDDRERAERIGVMGQQIAKEHFDYKSYSEALARFFSDCFKESVR